MEPRQLSEELRKGQSDDLTRRRLIVGLSTLGGAMGQIVTLYQTGVISDLPDPPIPIFDSSKVDASNYAYSRFNSPDGPLMILNYAITAWLASAGGKDRARNTPWLPIAMAGKTLMDSVLSAELAREEWSENEALCAYCQVATLASFASFALAIPEALAATRYWLGKRDSVKNS
ncbi:MAG: vitamin K epoxide reductase family protein [Myxacorys californica WJT36-NPBG1]|jgi:uncharacterized membrane protein|nr:vitamin K epoxide reductase family protein [Myxacorys californica WJT36-NPBG1]